MILVDRTTGAEVEPVVVDRATGRRVDGVGQDAVASRVVQRHDFIEGVRALILDKDNAPRWQPATPDGVSDHVIDQIFTPLPEDEAWAPA